IVATALLTVALLGLLGVGTLASYDRRAFRRLRFTGIVSEAPKAIELVRRGLADVDRLRLQIRYATTNLARFYRVLESQPPAARHGADGRHGDGGSRPALRGLGRSRLPAPRHRLGG